ncbi:MAG: MFS transporter [Thermotogae bacterium]|nr:MFS transporter [Thermotogota bacterium]
MKMLAVALNNALAAIGITVIVPILGLAADIYGIDQSSAMWLMTGFMLTYAAFMPIFGKLSDIYGRKKIFVISTLIYSAGLFLSAVSKNFVIVVVGRMVQGLGSGGILPVSNAMAIEIMKDKKEKALSIVNATYGLGMILGVNLGGVLHDYLGVFWIYMLPMLLSLAGAGLAAIILKENVPGSGKKDVDIPGSSLFAAAMMGLILFMREIGRSWPLSIEGFLYLVASGVAFVIFVFVELKVKEPAIDIKDFRNPAFMFTSITAILFGMAMFTLITFMAPYVQVLLSWSVSASVYAVDPFAAIMTVAIAFGGALSRRFGHSKVMAFGLLFLSAAAYLFSAYTTGTASFFAFSILLALAVGIPMTPMNHIAMEELGEAKRGIAAGMISIMRSVGGMIGPAMAGIIFARTDFSSIFAFDNILASYRKVQTLASISALIGAGTAFIGIAFMRKKEKRNIYERREAA